MLTALSIRNIILIDHLALDFQQGLSIFSGETGAGKSILLESLMLALGGRADSQIIRQGESSASVSVTFDIANCLNVIELLKEQEIYTEELILRRTIYTDGRNKAFMNDHPVSVSFLRKIGQQLIEIHEQFDQLLEPASHRRVLDHFGQYFDILEQVRQHYSAWINCQRQLEHFLEQQHHLQTQETYLRQMVEELESVQPQEGEETLLIGKRAVQGQFQKIKTALKSAEKLLTNDNVLFQSERILSKLSTDLENQLTAPGAEITEKAILDKVITALNSALCEREEALRLLQMLDKNVNDDDQNLEQIEDRLHQLRALGRKHRCLPDALPLMHQKLKEDLEHLDKNDKILADLRQQQEQYQKIYQERAQQLSSLRAQSAAVLDQKVNQELPLLKLSHARFKTTLEPLPMNQWNETGLERIEFTVQTNLDTPFGGLGKIASGGERARFMLAIKVALAGKGTVPTLIFDEVDAGTGGAVAAALGNRLQHLSQHLQIFVITHAPQVAALATHHFHVSKLTQQGKTVTTVEHLSPSKRREEIARMLSGEQITDQAREAADRLISRS